MKMSKRVFCLFLVLVMCLSLLPVSAFAEEDPEQLDIPQTEEQLNEETDEGLEQLAPSDEPAIENTGEDNIAETTPIPILQEDHFPSEGTESSDAEDQEETDEETDFEIASVITSGVCGKEGDDLTWSLQSGGYLVVSGTGEMEDYDDVSEAPWATLREQIRYIIISQGVTRIGAAAFKDCNSATIASISDGVEYIGKESFCGCIGLTNITIPQGVTCIGDDAFRDCTGLQSIKIPDSILSIGDSAFKNCAALTYIDIPEGVNSIGSYAFANCNDLYLYYYGSPYLWETITDGNTNVISDSATLRFAYLYKGTCGEDLAWKVDNDYSLIISGTGEMDDYSEDEAAPWSAYREQILKLGINNGLTYIGNNAFNGCSNMSGITIPESVTGIGDNAFSGCVNMAWCLMEGHVTRIGDGAFRNCTSFSWFDIPDSVTYIGDEAFLGCTGLDRLTILLGVEIIGNAAFQDCTGLTGVSIPRSVESIGSYAFAGCENIVVNYLGTQAQWDSITEEKGNYNVLPDSATLVCSAVTDGNCGENIYWHIDEYNVLNIYGTGEMYDYESFSDAPWYSEAETIEMIVVEEGVTSIGSNAFASCSNCNYISLPLSVISIGASAFDHILSVEYSGTRAQWFEIIIDEDNESISYIRRVKAIDYSFGFCGAERGNLTWVEDSSGTLTISGTGAMADYRAYGSYDFTTDPTPFGSSAKTVLIEEGVTSIGDSAFNDCAFISGVVIPSTVTKIGNRAFEMCYSLESIQIPDGVTIIGENAFSLCSNLTSITIPSTVETIGLGAFSSTAITSVTVPSSLDTIASYTFVGCNRLETVIVSDGVKSIGDNAFKDCDLLSNVILPSTLTSIGNSAFINCTSLENITLSTGINYIGEEAFKCSGIKNIAIPEGVKTINMEVFCDCTSLKSITIPSSVEAIGYKAFNNCTSLNAVYISDLASWCTIDFGNYSNQVIDNPLSYAKNLYLNGLPVKNLEIPESVTAISDRAFIGCETITSVIIPQTVVSIGNKSFQYCSGLTTLTISSGVNSIGVMAFADCEGLTSVTIPSSVTFIGEKAFADCTSLYTITFGHSSASALTIQSWAFMLNTDEELPTVIRIPDDSVGVYSTLQNSYLGRSIITWEWYPVPLDWDYRDGVLTVSGKGGIADSPAGGAPWAEYSADIKEIVIGSGITRIGRHAFQDCINVTIVRLPDSGLTEIGDYAFYNCKKLSYLVTSAAEIGEFAFAYCNAMTSVVLQEGTAYIGPYAFSHCAKLSSVNLPMSLQTVRQDAFYDCPALKTAVYPGSDDDWGLVSLYNGNEALTNALKLGITIDYMAGDNIIWEIEDGVLRFKGSGRMNGYPDGAPWASYKNEITLIEIENGIQTIGNRAFYGLINVKKVSLPPSLLSIGDYAFWECNNLTSVFIPDNVRTIGAWSFAYCTKLVSARLPAALKTIGRSAFFNCTSLNNVALPDKLETMGINAFALCSSLPSIRIPASLTYIDEAAFSGCTALSTVSFSKTLQMIHTAAFDNCTALATVNYTGTKLQWETLLAAMGENNDCLKNATISYSKSEKSIKITYKNTSGAYNPNPTAFNKNETYLLQEAVKEGYIFNGWFSDSKCKKAITTVTADKDKTIYAKFTALTYTVHFDGNGSTSGTMKDQKLTSGKSTALLGIGFKRTGYSFLGWTLDPEYVEEEDTIYGNKSKVDFEIDAQCIILYAQWKPTTYKITYSGIGISDSNPNFKTTFTVEDSDIILQNASRPGCVFEGWYADSKHKTPITSIHIDKENPKAVTVYAKWSGTPNTYNIVFDGNGVSTSHSGVSGTTKVVHCNLNTTYTLSTNGFKRAGYKFSGWNTERDGSGTQYTDKQKKVAFSPTYQDGASTTDIVLYAQWEAINYAITYVNAGGEAYNSENRTTYTVEDYFILRAPSSEVFSDFCTFTGWWTKDKKGKYADNITEIKYRTGDLTLYAKWDQEDITYNIVFHSNNGDTDSTRKQENLKLATDYTLAENKFKKTGYTFVGWSLVSDAKEPMLLDKGKISYSVLFDLSGQTHDDVFDLYAVWKPNYIIHFNGNGGTGSMKDQKADYNKEITLQKNTFIRADYMFMGWSEDEDAWEAKWKGRAKVKNINNGEKTEMTLYAVWKPVAGYISAEGTQITTTMVTWNAERYIAALDEDGDGKLNLEWRWAMKKTKGPIMSNANEARTDPSKYLTYLSKDAKRSDSNGFSGCKECAGFANFMVYVTMGLAPGNFLCKEAGTTQIGTYTYSFSDDYQFQAGDYCRIPGSSDGSHSIFIYKVSGNTVYFIDCNSDHLCGIRTGTYKRSTLIGKLNTSGKDWLWRGPVVEG